MKFVTGCDKSVRIWGFSIGAYYLGIRFGHWRGVLLFKASPPA